MTLQVENVNMVYTSCAYQMLGTDEDFSADGAVYGVLVSEEQGDQVLIQRSDIGWFYDGRENRMNALEDLVRVSRKAGENPVAIFTVGNFWYVPSEEGDDWDGWPSQHPNRKSGRHATIVDAAGLMVTAERREGEDGMSLDTTNVSPTVTFGLLPAQMLAAIRGTKAPSCYLCGRTTGALREFGPVFTETKTFSGVWACPHGTAEVDAECQARADRKFTKKQQHQNLRRAFKTMLTIVPEEMRDEQREMLEGLLGSKL